MRQALAGGGRGRVRSDRLPRVLRARGGRGGSRTDAGAGPGRAKHDALRAARRDGRDLAVELPAGDSLRNDRGRPGQRQRRGAQAGRAVARERRRGGSGAAQRRRAARRARASAGLRRRRRRACARPTGTRDRVHGVGHGRARDRAGGRGDRARPGSREAGGLRDGRQELRDRGLRRGPRRRRARDRVLRVRLRGAEVLRRGAGARPRGGRRYPPRAPRRSCERTHRRAGREFHHRGAAGDRARGAGAGAGLPVAGVPPRGGERRTSSRRGLVRAALPRVRPAGRLAGESRGDLRPASVRDASARRRGGDGHRRRPAVRAHGRAFLAQSGHGRGGGRPPPRREPLREPRHPRGDGRPPAPRRQPAVRDRVQGGRPRLPAPVRGAARGEREHDAPRDSGGVGDPRTLVYPRAPVDAPSFDLQSHSLHSDGELPAAGVVENAARAGAQLLAMSDHDTVDGVDEALAAGALRGVRVVPATEISAVDGPYEDLHVLGYGIDHRSGLLAERLRDARGDRERRAEAMTRRLRELGFAIDPTPIEARRAAGKPVGRPHLAAAVLGHPGNEERLRAEGHSDVSSFIASYLIQGKPGYMARTHPTVEEAIGWIHDAAGVAVWAHPFWDIKDEQEVLAAIDRYAAAGLDGVEVFYASHTEEQTLLLADRCAELGMLTTGSSDYHGPEHRLFNRFRAFELHGREPNLGPIAHGTLAAPARSGTGLCIWLTGLSGSGKSTVGRLAAGQLRDRGYQVEVLDRDEARARMGDRFVEVYVRASVEECERRDVKGLYERARAGEIKGFTGVSDPYEEPLAPELTLDTESDAPQASAARLVELVERRLAPPATAGAGHPKPAGAGRRPPGGGPPRGA